MVKEIRVNATKIEFEDDELAATRTLKQLSDGTYVTGGITPISGWVEGVSSVPFAFGGPDMIVGSYEVTYMQKSDKIRYKQGGAYKYGYVISVTDQTTSWFITVAGDTVANAAITDMAYSHIENPLGFPQWFNWTPTLTGGNTDLSAFTVAKFKIAGNELKIIFKADAKNLSGTAGNIQVTLPVTIVNTPNLPISVFNGVANTLSMCGLTTTYIMIYKDGVGTNWVANETGVYINIVLSCDI